MTMDYAQSVSVVSSFLLNLSEKGLDFFVTNEFENSAVADGHSDNYLLLCALSSLRGEPSHNRLLAETLLQSVFAALEPSIEKFQDTLLRARWKRSRKIDSLCDFPSSSHADNEWEKETMHAFLSLHNLYTLIRSHTQKWCTLLEVPCIAELLPTKIRFKLLQHSVLDISTKEEDHPTSKAELFHFLRQYLNQLLFQLEESPVGGFSVQNDSIIKSLHDLTLISTREIQGLLLEVLIHCLQQKIDALDENYTVRVLEAYLMWEERVIEPFLHVCFPSPQPVSTRHSLKTFGFGSQLHTKEKHMDCLTSLSRGFENEEVHEECSRSQTRHGRGEEENSYSVRQALEDEEGGCCEHYRMLVTDWSASMQHRLRLLFGRKRLATFWNVLVDFPDSIPALEDLHTCIQLSRNGILRQELIVIVRALLAQRLHRAGVRTEDIIEMLIKTVYALFIVLSYSEQIVVFSIIGDTLAHVRMRKDCATAVVHSMAQLSELHLAKGAAMANGAASSAGRNASGFASASTVGEGEAPDFFRVLSTVIPISELVSGYRSTLSAQLLSKKLHDYDTSSEEEILERLKCSVGERLLSNCMIMVRDVAFSRRVSLRLVDTMTSNTTEEEDKGNLCANGLVVLPPVSSVRTLILSRVAWPEKLQRLRGAVSSGKGAGGMEGGEISLSFTSHQFSLGDSSGKKSFSLKIHPSLERLMTRLSNAFHLAMPNRKLCWHSSLGRVRLHWMQWHVDKKKMVVMSFVVSIFSASVLLYLQEVTASSSSTPFRNKLQDSEGKNAEHSHHASGSSLHMPESSEVDAIPISKLAEVLEINETALERFIDENLAPRMVAVHYRPNRRGNQEKEELWVHLQTRHSLGGMAGGFPASKATLVDEGAGGNSSETEKEEQFGLSPQQQVQFRKTVLALLRAARQKTFSEITNSLKQFSPLAFVASDLKALLKSLEEEGLIVTVEGGGYRFKR